MNLSGVPFGNMVGYPMGFMPPHPMGNMPGHPMATMSGHPMATMSLHSMGRMAPATMGNLPRHPMGMQSLSQGSTPSHSVGNMTFNPPMSQPSYTSPNAGEEDEEEVAENQDDEGDNGNNVATRGPSFSPLEDEVICSAYLNTCTDPIVGKMPFIPICLRTLHFQIRCVC
jgi:hypothetical protein